MPDPSDLREQDSEQPEPQPQPQPSAPRRRRVAVALASLGIVLVTSGVITVAVTKHSANPISNDPGCKEFTSQLAGFQATPPMTFTDYAGYAKYYGAYYFPAAYAMDDAQNDQVHKTMMALRDASDTVQTDATQDEMVNVGTTPIPQSKLDADTLTFHQALTAVDSICNLR